MYPDGEKSPVQRLEDFLRKEERERDERAQSLRKLLAALPHEEFWKFDAAFWTARHRLDELDEHLDVRDLSFQQVITAVYAAREDHEVAEEREEREDR